MTRRLSEANKVLTGELCLAALEPTCVREEKPGKQLVNTQPIRTSPRSLHPHPAHRRKEARRSVGTVFNFLKDFSDFSLVFLKHLRSKQKASFDLLCCF